MSKPGPNPSKPRFPMLPFTIAATLWRSKLLIVAIAVLSVLIYQSHHARVERAWMDQLDRLPEYDWFARVAALRQEGGLLEAYELGQAALPVLNDPQRSAMTAQIEAIERERNTVLNTAVSVLRGAAIGEADDWPGLLAALGTDLFVVGDVRDLAIQGTRLAWDGQSDPVIAALSLIGIATTAAPPAELGVSLLKVARRAGAMSTRFAADIVKLAHIALKTGDFRSISKLGTDVTQLFRDVGVGPGMRLLSHAENAGDIARLADITRRYPHARLAMRVAGPDAVALIRRGPRGGEWLSRAATKGPAGLAVLRRMPDRLLRPHVVIGGVKGLWKGNVAKAFWQMPGEWPAVFIALVGVWLAAVGLLCYRIYACVSDAGGRRTATHTLA